MQRNQKGFRLGYSLIWFGPITSGLILYFLSSCQPSTGQVRPCSAGDNSATYLEKTGLPGIEFFGRAELKDTQTSRRTPAVYYVFQNPQSFQSVLRIESTDPEREFDFFEYSSEVGQEHLTAVNLERFGDAGCLICTRWDWGAGSQQLIVFGLSQGKIKKLFQGICRMGFNILDLAGHGTPDICSLEGDLRATQWEAQVFSWNGSKFERSKSVAVSPNRIFDLRAAYTTAEKVTESGSNDLGDSPP